MALAGPDRINESCTKACCAGGGSGAVFRFRVLFLGLRGSLPIPRTSSEEKDVPFCSTLDVSHHHQAPTLATSIILSVSFF